MSVIRSYLLKKESNIKPILCHCYKTTRKLLFNHLFLALTEFSRRQCDSKSRLPRSGHKPVTLTAKAPSAVTDVHIISTTPARLPLKGKLHSKFNASWTTAHRATSPHRTHLRNFIGKNACSLSG